MSGVDLPANNSFFFFFFSNEILIFWKKNLFKPALTDMRAVTIAWHLDPLLLPLASPLRSSQHSFTAHLPRVSVVASVLPRTSHCCSFVNMRNVYETASGSSAAPRPEPSEPSCRAQDPETACEMSWSWKITRGIFHASLPISLS